MRLMLVGAASARGLALTHALVAEGHAVRAVTRTEEHRGLLEAAGAEVWIGTPDRIGSLRNGLDNVTILAWCLGTAAGAPEAVEPLHGSRWHMMLEKTIDTTVRGVLYEAAGTVDPAVLAAGAAITRTMHEQNEIPYRLLEVDPAETAAWTVSARAAIEDLLA
jgi:NAD(P)-dependent dehydrogenase (short-subunit alcohol dehydrogenase family)